MTNGKDSRRDPRAKVLAMTVRYKSATVAEFMENHSYDVSRGGLFIKTPSPFPPGTLLKFEVRIAEDQKVMMGVGRVTWKRDVDAGPEKPAGMGVKFIKLDDESTRLIGDLVDKRAGAEAGFEEGARESGVTVSAPPPPVESKSDPDKSVIAHTADILRSALDATRTPTKAEEDERSTLPTSIPAPSSIRKPSAPPRPAASRVPAVSKAAEAPVSNTATTDAHPAEAAKTSDVSADEKPAQVEAEDKSTAAQSAASPASPSVESDSATKPEVAKVEPVKDEPTKLEPARADTPPISTLTTTPPRRSHAEHPAPKSGSRAIWIVLGLVVVVGAYYFITKVRSTAETAEPPTPPEPLQASAPSEPTAPADNSAELAEPSGGVADAPSSEPSASALATSTATAVPEAPTAEETAAASAEPPPARAPRRPRAPRPSAPRPSAPATPPEAPDAPSPPKPETPTETPPSPPPAPAPAPAPQTSG